MADATAPATEPAPAASVSAESGAKQPTVTTPSEEPTTESTPAMSGALQSPDADVAKAPEATEESKVNGEASGPISAEKSVDGEDAEMKDTDTGKTDATESVAETGAENASASTRKAANGKRKSTGGVPEHKNKKLNKKKSMPKLTHLDAQPGEYYFARLKSYPPWPSIICDEEMLPTSLLTTRPVTTKQADGSFKEAYGPGGKREHERTFPIMFLHTNEFAWIPNTDLSPLNPDDCNDVVEKGKSKSLISAYKVAAENKDLEHYKNMLLDHQRALEDDARQREERQAEKAAKVAAKSDAKKKRKSVDASAAVADDDDVEMEDVGDDEAPDKAKSSKKRKKDVESDGETEKTPKTATKLKLTTPKAPETGKKAKDSAKPTKAKGASTKKGKAEAEATPAPKEPEKSVDPAEAKAKKEREVLYLRHKLQKGFLTRDTPPKEEEMKTMSGYIQKLEEYEDLEVSIIRATKVNKVLKAIIKLNTIPKDEEFNFRKRSHDLLESWNKLLGADGPESGANKDDEQPTTNGVHKEEEKEGSAEKEPAPKVAAPTEAADVKKETTLPDAPAEAKETVIDKLVEGDAVSGVVAAEADKPAEEVKNDAEETNPSTD